ncbi:subtilisin family serine protease [Streptomyces olivoverticillatus]|uniref:Subtilisin family serine protease n=1 Tax=Streptomyces olivoverticillatus TaxID=66427 RepID=A0A7W7PLQ7_9ACTN|nr:S8 family serine peptidase [Streptomyces olivoverticillatus]MBB4893075.1 subtilisin family serine protease [Streptomyces olivoverticillatus]
MAQLRSRRRHALLAVPVGLALTTSLGLLPGIATAAPQGAHAAKTPVRTDGPLLSYVVNTDSARGTLARVKKAVADAGGTVTVAYGQIGVVVAHSKNPDFAKALRAVPGVQSAGATRTAPITPAATTDYGKPERLKASDAKALAAARTAKPGQEPLEGLQWDIGAIGADKAAKVNPGSRKVTVGVIDTGVDDTHPDLAPNFSKGQSASCVTGKADTTPGAWRPFNPDEDYHGTHVAGEIAAARNGIGVAGVAPGVKVSAIKVSTAKGSFFYAESVVCAFVFAAEHHIAVTNNSYFVDPWMFNCADDPDQKAIADAVGRAAKYAQDKGTVNVASAGNSNFDLAAKEIADASSPNDNSKPLPRKIDPHTCLDVPAQLPGVVTVAATGVKSQKSFYSNYGLNAVDVAAPGGDSMQVPDLPAKDGRILSTMPGGDYAYLQGTSMAGPHVAGVAALLKSAHPKSSPQEIQWLLKAQAKNPGCPTAAYDPDGKGTWKAACTGTRHVNSFYGFGIVDALAAVRD